MMKILGAGAAAAMTAVLVALMLPSADLPAAVTLTGEVTVHEESEEGEILSLYLSDTEEGDVLIVKNGMWDQLLDYLDEEVVATGTLRPAASPEFSFEMTVTSFTPEDDEDDDDDDEDDDEDEDDDDDEGGL